MTGQNSVSLRRILEELRRHPEIVSREYFVGLYGGEDGMKEMGHRTFDSLAGPGAERLDSKRIEQDLKQLDRMADQIKHYTNRQIAHYDERGLRQDLPTFDDLTKCLKGLDELVKKYKLVLEGRPWFANRGRVSCVDFPVCTALENSEGLLARYNR